MTDEVIVQTPEQERQAAETAFAATDEAPVKATDKPEAQPAATKATEAPTTTATTEPAVDRWEGVPLVVKESLEGITNRLATLDRIDHRLKSTEGRVGAIQTALAAAKADTTKAGAEAPTKEQVAAAAASSDKWKQLETDFPEWTMALNERLTAMSAELAGKIPKVDVEGITKGVVDTVSPMFAAVKSEARELARVDMKHDAWEDTVKTKEFGDWFAKQTTDLQALADSEKAADAIKLLDAYKASIIPAPETDPAKLKQHQRLESAIPAKGMAGQRQPTQSERDAAEKAFASA